jgi:signal transduction histidine kinase
LGLFLVKEFLDPHHGGVEVVSTVGEGSEFIVTLRLGRDHFSPEEIIIDSGEVDRVQRKRGTTEDRRKDDRRSGYDRRLGNREDQDTISFMQVQLSDLDYNRNRDFEAVAPAPVSDENKKNILVVEDNHDLANNIARCLMASHYNVFVTYNGAQAMARVKQELPDLIVSDVMMPEMDGNELCKRVKEDERTQHIPIILLTAKAGLADKIIGLKQGADQYLAKPFNPMELLAVVESLLVQRELHAKLGKTLQELKEAQVQLVQAARMETVGQMASGLAHEVKNKMYCVRAGFEGINQRLSMLHEGKIKIEDIYDRLLKAMATNDEALKSSLDMVNTLLNFSRKNKETKGQMVAADLNKGVEDTVAIVVPMVKEKLTVYTELGAIPWVECCIEEINQVVMNLIINAYQAMIQPGEVRISTLHENDKVIITVKDNGPGIAAENIDKIFTPFFSTKEEGENTGLGLSICYNIIKEHNGTIEVQSDPGQGTVLRISLPVSQPEA